MTGKAESDRQGWREKKKGAVKNENPRDAQQKSFLKTVSKTGTSGTAATF